MNTGQALKYILIGIAIEAVGLLGFILLSKLPGSNLTKPTILILSVVSVAALLWVAARSLPFRSLVAIATGWTAGFIVVIQVLGFLFFPGLVKDVHFLSGAHLEAILALLALVYLAHIAGTVIVILIQSFIYRNDRSSDPVTPA